MTIRISFSLFFYVEIYMQSREGKYGDLHWVSLSFMLLETGPRFTKLSLDLTGCCCRFLYLPYTAFLSVQWILYFTKTSNEVRKVFKRRQIFSMPKEIKNSTNINRYTFICVNKKRNFIFKTDFRMDWCVCMANLIYDILNHSVKEVVSFKCFYEGGLHLFPFYDEKGVVAYVWFIVMPKRSKRLIDCIYRKFNLVIYSMKYIHVSY